MKKGRITQKKRATPRKVVSSHVIERVSPVRPLRTYKTEEVQVPHRWSLTARIVAFTLVLFFVLVPVGDAYADETVASEVVAVEAPVPVVTEPIVEEAPEEVAEPTPEEGVVPEVLGAVEVSEETVGDAPAETVVDAESQSPDANSDEEVVVDAEVPAVDTGSIEATTTQTDIILETEVSSSTPEDVVTTGGETTADESGEVATSTEPTPESVATTTVPVDEIVVPIPDVTVPEVAPTATTTTTEEVVATTTDVTEEVSTHTTDADRFTFGVTECVAMGNGAFQCVRGGESGAETEVRGPLYAAKDASGDMEIYLSTETGTRPITANEYDDDAPSADPTTGDIVWQAQIDDRMQVMHYNRETGATTRITKEAYNSMQPSIYEGDIAFQAWIGNDWEIVLVDDMEGRKILTDNATHDITPSITNDYIMWQAFEGEEWVGKVYDRRTAEIETVRGMDGGKVENPRMIMVFDSTKENGDTDTLGYDPVSGEVVSLAVTPVPVAPEKIPEPEPEQDEKALVQPSVTTRTETKNSTSTDSGDGSNATSTEPIVVDTASSTPAVAPVATTTIDGVPTLDLTTDAPVEDANVIPDMPVLTEIPDLVIPAFSSTANDEATTSPNL